MAFFDEQYLWYWKDFKLDNLVGDAIKLLSREALPIMQDAVKIEKFVESNPSKGTSTLNISRIKGSDKFKIRVYKNFVDAMTKDLYDFSWMIAHEISHYAIWDFLRIYPYIRADVLNIASDAYINARLFHLNKKLAKWTKKVYPLKHVRNSVFSLLRCDNKQSDIPPILRPIYLKLYGANQILASHDEIVRMVDIYMNLNSKETKKAEDALKKFFKDKMWKPWASQDWDDGEDSWNPMGWFKPYVGTHDPADLWDIGSWLDYINTEFDGENPYFQDFKSDADYSANFSFYNDKIKENGKNSLYNKYLEEIIKDIQEDSVLRDIRKSFSSENIMTDSFIPTGLITAKNIHLFKEWIYPTFQQPWLVNKFLNIWVDVSWSLFDKITPIFNLVKVLEREINIRVFAFSDWVIEVKLKDLYYWNFPRGWWNDDLWIGKAKSIKAEKDTNLVITDWFFDVRPEYGKYLYTNEKAFQYIFIMSGLESNEQNFAKRHFLGWWADDTFKFIKSKKYFMNLD